MRLNIAYCTREGENAVHSVAERDVVFVYFFDCAVDDEIEKMSLIA